MLPVLPAGRRVETVHEALDVTSVDQAVVNGAIRHRAAEEIATRVVLLVGRPAVPPLNPRVRVWLAFSAAVVQLRAHISSARRVDAEEIGLTGIVFWTL